MLLKREDLQPVFSFKLRGAYNKMRGSPRRSAARGVDRRLGRQPRPGRRAGRARARHRRADRDADDHAEIKVEAVAALGAAVVLHGDTYDDAYAHALRHRRGASSASSSIPYDDPDVIAGQGTIAVEILRQCREPIDAVFVPVGGGGLIAGIAAYVKRAASPTMQVIGVEPDDADALHAALARRRARHARLGVGLFADGVAVRQVGAEPFRIAQQYVDEVILVNTDEICAAIKDIFEDTRADRRAGRRARASPGSSATSSATGVRGADAGRDRERRQHELRPPALRLRAHRDSASSARRCSPSPSRSEPGSFRRFCTLLGGRSITEFNYRYSDPARRHIFVGVEGARRADTERATDRRRCARTAIRSLDLTDNELAKLHIRHLVGGRAAVPHELLYRFEFPERPGALLRFLNQMGERWNISLFHYRNHGAAYGRVLAGIQVPPERPEAPSASFLDRARLPVPRRDAQPRVPPVSAMIDLGARRRTLAASILGSSLAFLDAMVVVVALPRIAGDFGLGLAAEQWVLLAYSLPLVAMYLVAGAIGDRRGHRRVFVAGVVGFAAASALAGAAPTAGVLIGARVLQGTAAAFVTTNSLALLRDAYGDHAGRAIGLWASLTSVATLAGPPLGGAIAQWASWRWIFFLNLPLAIACVVLASRSGAGATPVARERIDYLGAATAAVGLGGATYALVEGANRGLSYAWWGIVLAVAGFAGFWLAERRAPTPLLPLVLFRERNFAAVSVETFFVYAAIAGIFTYFTLYLQFLGFSPVAAGIAELPADIALILFGSLMGNLADRYGPRAFLTAAPVLIGGAAVSFAFLETRSDFWSAGIIGLALLSAGLAVLVAPITADRPGVRASRAGRHGRRYELDDLTPRWPALSRSPRGRRDGRVHGRRGGPRPAFLGRPVQPGAARRLGARVPCRDDRGRVPGARCRGCRRRLDL